MRQEAGGLGPSTVPPHLFAGGAYSGKRAQSGRGPCGTDSDEIKVQNQMGTFSFSPHR